MIDINDFYKMTVEGVLSENREGHLSNGEFNRLLQVGEELLFDYYIDMANTRLPTDQLRLLVKDKIGLIQDGIAPIPVDYKRLIGFSVAKDTKLNWGSCIEYSGAESTITENNSIRKSGGGKNRVEVKSDSFEIYSDYSNGVYKVVYYKNIPYGVRVVDTTDNYDSSTSTNLFWEENSIGKLFDIMMYLCGIEIRTSIITPYLQGKQIVVQNNRND